MPSARAHDLDHERHGGGGNMNLAQAHRVLRRHRAALGRGQVIATDTTRVEYSDAEVITAIAVEKLLKPRLGYLFKLTFEPGSLPNTVAFEGVTMDDRQVRGRVVLHAAVRADTIISWGEVLVDDVGEPL